MVSRPVLITLLVICLVSGTLGGLVGAAITQRFSRSALVQQAAAAEASMRRACAQAIDAGKLEQCRDTLSQTCVVQWGKKCVGKAPRPDPYE